MTGQTLLDTHQHLVYTDKAGYGWTAGLAPLENKSFTLHDYQSLTEGLGVGGTLFMEAAVDDGDMEAENGFSSQVASASGSGILGLISTCRPETDEGFDAWLDACEGHNAVGYRRILHVVDDAVSQPASFRANVRKIGARGKVFDMCFLQRQLGIARELAEACDNTTLVLDHCGVPDIAGGDIEAWRAGIDALAELPHVNCKLSGILAYCPAGQANLATIRPYVDHVLDKFGPGRTLWGSDWPVVDLANGLADWIGVTREIRAGLSDGEAAAVAHETAERVYGVKLPQAV